MILLIDNYDSFTYNLVHLIGQIRNDLEVRRNDKLTVADALNLATDAIVLSPGPCTPDDAGICVDLVREAAKQSVPLLGVCLGHQAIAQAFGARIVKTNHLMHGKTSQIIHDGTGLFHDIPSGFIATRYHSLVVEKQSVPGSIVPIAASGDDQEIMAIRIMDKPIYGVQFHPESIATEYGATMIQNFFNAALPSRSAV